MPKRLAHAELLVLVDGLAAAAALGAAERVDDWLVDDVACLAGLGALGLDAAVCEARVRARADAVLAVAAQQHALLARVAVKLLPAQVALALVADEAVEVVVLRAHHLVQQRAALLLAHRADHVFCLARPARRHGRRVLLCCRRWGLPRRAGCCRVACVRPPQA